MYNCALNSVHTLRRFQAATSRMSKVDYDLKTICANVINHLRDSNDMNTLAAYCESFRHLNKEDGFDGDIMAQALQNLGQDLLALLRQMRLYSADGKLHYRFQTLISQTIMVEVIK